MAVYGSSVGWGRTLACKDSPFPPPPHQSIYWSHSPTHPTHEYHERQMKSEIEINHHTVVLRPLLFEQCASSLTSHTGPMVSRPYPRRLKSVTVWRCHYVNNITCPTFFCSISFRYNRSTAVGGFINVSNMYTGKPTLVCDQGPIARNPVNANLELKINQGIYFYWLKSVSDARFSSK